MKKLETFCEVEVNKKMEHIKENENNKEAFYQVDVVRIVKALWHRAWIIVLSCILAGALAFSYASFLIAPKYSSSVMLYVNNSSFSVGGTSFSLSELSAAQSLVKTYIVILNNRTTLEEVIEKVGVDYTYKELSAMTTAAAVDDTEVFQITVTSEDAYEAQKLASSMAEVLTERVSKIIDGASMRVVDKAAVKTEKVSPSITRYTEIGMILGFLISCVILVIIELMDDVIHDEDYVINTYNIPVLAKIPNLTEDKKGKKYGYYYYRSSKAKD